MLKRNQNTSQQSTDVVTHYVLDGEEAQQKLRALKKYNLPLKVFESGSEPITFWFQGS